MRPILLDTDVLINFLRGKEKARHFLEAAAGESVLLCSVITVAEIYSGMLVQETERTRGFLDGLEIIEITKEIAEKAGAYKRETKSHRLELMDYLVAATAHCNHAILATGNAKHYPMQDIETLPVPV